MKPVKQIKPRHLALGAALLAAAALVLFGDRSPEGEVAEAVLRPTADVGRAAPAVAGATGATGAAAAGATAATSAAAQVPSSIMPTAGQGVAEHSTRAAQPARPDSGPRQPILALVPREVLIGDSDSRFGQDQNGVFGSQSWMPPAPPQAAMQAPPPPPPPTAPPLPFTFIGKSVGGGVWEVYLARGDRTYVARANEVLDGSYRVDAIAPPVLTLTYLPLNQVQQLNIGVFE